MDKPTLCYEVRGNARGESIILAAYWDVYEAWQHAERERGEGDDDIEVHVANGMIVDKETGKLRKRRSVK